MVLALEQMQVPNGQDQLSGVSVLCWLAVPRKNKSFLSVERNGVYQYSLQWDNIYTIKQLDKA